MNIDQIKEVWVLKLPNGRLVPPNDDDGTEVFMAWPSEREAQEGLEHQKYHYDVQEAEAVRLFPAS